MAEWLCAYDLRDDGSRREQLQRASAGPGPSGLVPEPAVAGSDEWFSAIESGALPTGETSGPISKVWWGSMADWPEFTITEANGATSDWTREGDIRRYVPGITGRVTWVEVRHKPGGLFANLDLPETHKMTLRIELQPSAERSSGVAPGPGGAGWKQIGGPGTVISYVVCPSGRDADQTRAAVESLGRAHHWGSGGDVWLRVAGPSAATVRATIKGSDALFDGYEVIREHQPPDVFGPEVP